MLDGQISVMKPEGQHKSSGKKRIKVLHCIRQGAIGGGESHVLDLVSHLDPATYESIVIAFTPGAMIDRLNASQVKTYVIPTTRPFDVRVWGKVKEVVAQENIDVIHAHGTRALSNVYWAGQSLHIPVVYTVHGWSIHESESGIKKRIRIAGERFLTRRAQVTINVSDSNQETGKKYIPGFQSTIIKYGIDLRKFDRTIAFTNIRKELGIPEDITLVGYIVRITEQKDPLTMVRAFHQVTQREQGIGLLMMGDGDLKPDAVRLIKELGIEDKVYFQPFRTDIPAVLQSIDIYCLPSLWEGLPIGMLEAMAMGKAVIATAVDGTKEVIKHEENGMLITPRDVQGLADAICLLHTKPALRKQLGDRAFETVDQKFDAVKMAKAIGKVYEKLLAASF